MPLHERGTKATAMHPAAHIDMECSEYNDEQVEQICAELNRLENDLDFFLQGGDYHEFLAHSGDPVW